MSDKENLKREAEGYRRRASDLLAAALKLAELLEMPRETPRADGGRPLRRLSMVWDDAAERIAEVQKSALYCADDVDALLCELEYCRNEQEATRRTLAQYADEVEAAKEKQRAAENRAGMLADIYGHLCGMTADRLSDEERQKHREFRARLQRKRKQPQ